MKEDQHPRLPGVAATLALVAAVSSVSSTIRNYRGDIQPLAFAIDVLLGFVVTWLCLYGIALVVHWVYRKVVRA